MAQTLSLKIPKVKKFFVKEQDKVSEGTVLLEGREQGEKEVLSLAQVFKINSGQIFKVLVKKVGDWVGKGEVLAEKTGILGRVVLKSPIEGRVVELSEVSGEVTLAGKEKKVVIKTPVSGKIKKIGEDKIEIEFEGALFKGRGGGEKTLGVVENLAKDAGVLDLSAGSGGKILVGANFSPSVLAKAWVLGAAGVVSTGFSSKEPPMAFLAVDKKTLQALKDYQGKKAILDPESGQLIVLLELRKD